MNARHPAPPRPVLSNLVIGWMGAAVVLLPVTMAVMLVIVWGVSDTGGRIEAINTAVITGLAVSAVLALLLAARRQRGLELERLDRYQAGLDAATAQKRQALTELVSRQDAERRRDTELYAGAVAQMGSDRAAVRLGGLYALEQLGQDSTGQRQLVIDLLCAYLRMPPTTVAAGPVPNPLDMQPGGQEREVRLTAQRILHRHLLPPPNDPHPDPDPRADDTRHAGAHDGDTHDRDTRDGDTRDGDTCDGDTGADTRDGCPRGDTGAELRPVAGVGRYWPGMDIDLTGAWLEEFTLAGCVVGTARFDRARFQGAAVLDRARFHGDATFTDAHFAADAVFAGTRFGGRTEFGRVRVAGNVWFTGAVFTRDARFTGAWFGAGVLCEQARFAAAAQFDDTEFLAAATFRRAWFATSAQFDGARFGDTAAFDHARFDGDARFGHARFTGATEFTGARAEDWAPAHPSTWPQGWATRAAEEPGRLAVVPTDDPAPATVDVPTQAAPATTIDTIDTIDTVSSVGGAHD